VDGVTFAPDGKTLVSGGYDDNVILLDITRTPCKLVKTGLSADGVVFMSFSPDVKTPIVIDKDRIILLDKETGKSIGNQYIAGIVPGIFVQMARWL